MGVEDACFTARRNPLAEEKVSHDLEQVAERIQQALPSFLSVAVIGAFGRGEGAVVETPDGFRPWNDYDILVVTETREGWEKLGELSRSMAKDLALPAIDILPFTPEDLVRKADTMLVYDACHGNVVLKGDTGVFSRLPARRIRFEEIRILLLNRMVCLLESPPRSLTGEEPDLLLHPAQVSKALFAVVDATLVQERMYVTRYRDKAARFQSIDGPSEELKAAVAKALSFRLSPAPQSWDERLWFLARNFLIQHVAKVLGIASNGDATHVAHAHWKHRFPPAISLVKALIRGRRPKSPCRAVECAELLILAAASPEPNGIDTALLARARAFLRKVKDDPTDGDWAQMSAQAVALWFELCHG